jgi:hypothetical protein
MKAASVDGEGDVFNNVKGEHTFCTFYFNGLDTHDWQSKNQV